jgi:hypothetical protein
MSVLDGLLQGLAPNYSKRLQEYRQMKHIQDNVAPHLLDPYRQANLGPQHQAITASLQQALESGDPDLVKQSFEMLGNLQDRTFSMVMPTDLVKNVRYMGLRPGDGEGRKIMHDYLIKPNTQVNIGDKGVTHEEAQHIVDAEGNPPAFVPMGITRDEAASRGWGYGHVPTQEEAKGQAGSDVAFESLDRMQDLMDSGIDMSGFGGALSRYRSESGIPNAAVDQFLNATGYKLSPEEAAMLSEAENLSNSMIAAMRGASVGPEEQAKFERSLPVVGQPAALFKANLATTRRNLEILNARKSKSRGYKPKASLPRVGDRQSPPPQSDAPKVVDSFTHTDGKTYYKMSDGKVMVGD